MKEFVHISMEIMVYIYNSDIMNWTAQDDIRHHIITLRK